jgi:hypothetical protein
MGMTCGVWRVQSSEIERLMADSGALEAFLYPGEEMGDDEIGDGIPRLIRRDRVRGLLGVPRRP